MEAEGSMARLRRDSTESYHVSQNNKAGPWDNERSACPPQPIRRSPRKKQPPERPSTHAVDPLAFQSLPELVPKHTRVTSPRMKQIRLAPLKSANTISGAPSGMIEAKQRASVRPRPPPSTSLGAAERASPALAAAPGIAQSDDELDHVEESIWCGSDAESDGSEDALPSPRKIISRSIKAPPSVDIISEHDFLVCRARDLLPNIPRLDGLPSQLTSKTATESRPSSSSDKENHNRAILRFSPPRLHTSQRPHTPERPVTPPPSPGKGRLLSPSKRAAQVPTPPHRPSIDTFWNPETVNAWNEQYSPRKQWSPRKHTSGQREDPASPTASPRKQQSPSKRTKADLATRKDWEARKHELAESFLAELDAKVANKELTRLAQSTGGVRLIWSKTLNSTAGRANWRRETIKRRQADGSTTHLHNHHASIELAEKVIDDEHRLLNVVAHEFCHLANFMISGIKDQPHGRSFKAWGAKCTRGFADRGVEVTTKHTYQIEYKYIWRCENELCAAEFKRHSKSIDPKRHRCGRCREKLVQVKPVPRANGSNGGYAAYVKANFASVRADLPSDATHKMIMEAVAKRYRAEKAMKDKVIAGVDPLPISSGSSQLEMEPDAEAKADESMSSDIDQVARRLEFVVLDD